MIKKQMLVWGIAALVLSSCAYTPKATITYDDAIPPEKSAWISLTQVGTVTGYNGISVNWSSKLTGVQGMVQIPSGNTLLELNIDAQGAYVHYTGKGILFRYNFQPQKQYTFWVRELDGQFGMSVYAYDLGEKITMKNWNNEVSFVEFVPFMNTNTKTILN